MAYTSKPWTIEEEPKNLKEFKKEAQMKELAKRNKVVQPVTVARIVEFLDKNKNKTFTNAEIAAAIGVRSVSSIMDKLEEIGAVKVVKIRKGIVSGISQVYQSAKGDFKKSVEKERMAEGLISKTLRIFEASINKIYSRADLAEVLGVDKNDLSPVISILLSTDKIKPIAEKGSEVIRYQNINGNKAGLKYEKNADPSYITLGSYLKMNNIKAKIKDVQKKCNEKGQSRFFQSEDGFIKEYKIEYLQKVLGTGEEKKSKKGLIERIRIWS